MRSFEVAQGWAARIGAGVLGSALSAVVFTIAVIRLYPDARGLNRLYAGVFLGVAAWIAMIFWCLLATNGASAWRRALTVAGCAGAALAFDAWLAHAG